MRNFLLIFFIVFLLTPIISSSQNDTLKRDSMKMRYRYMKEESPRQLDPVPVIEDNDTIFLCIYLQSLPNKAYDDFCANLEKEGIKVLSRRYSDDIFDPVVTVELTNKLIGEIFNGIVKYKYVPASSFSGYSMELFVESYSIPDTYKNIIKFITATDPQVGGC